MDMYINGKRTFGEAATSILIDSALGGLFAAMGYKGTDTLKKEMNMLKKTKEAIKMTRDIVHPNVRKRAGHIFRNITKYTLGELKDNSIENLFTGGTEYGISELVDTYMEYN